MLQVKDDGLTVFQRAKIRLGSSHPAEQTLILLDRIEKLEKLIKEMLKPDIITDGVIGVEMSVVGEDIVCAETGEENEIRRKRGRPKKVS